MSGEALLAGSGEKWQVRGDCGWVYCLLTGLHQCGEGQQCAAGAWKGEMANEAKKECVREVGVWSNVVI